MQGDFAIEPKQPLQRQTLEVRRQLVAAPAHERQRRGDVRRLQQQVEIERLPKRRIAVQRFRKRRPLQRDQRNVRRFELPAQLGQAGRQKQAAPGRLQIALVQALRDVGGEQV